MTSNLLEIETSCTVLTQDTLLMEDWKHVESRKHKKIQKWKNKMLCNGQNSLFMNFVHWWVGMIVENSICRDLSINCPSMRKETNDVLVNRCIQFLDNVFLPIWKITRDESVPYLLLLTKNKKNIRESWKYKIFTKSVKPFVKSWYKYQLCAVSKKLSHDLYCKIIEFIPFHNPKKPIKCMNLDCVECYKPHLCKIYNHNDYYDDDFYYDNEWRTCSKRVELPRSMINVKEVTNIFNLMCDSNKEEMYHDHLIGDMIGNIQRNLRRRNRKWH